MPVLVCILNHTLPSSAVALPFTVTFCAVVNEPLVLYVVPGPNLTLHDFVAYMVFSEMSSTTNAGFFFFVFFFLVFVLVSDFGVTSLLELVSVSVEFSSITASVVVALSVVLFSVSLLVVDVGSSVSTVSISGVVSDVVISFEVVSAVCPHADNVNVNVIANNIKMVFFFICFNSFVFLHYITGLHTRQENIKKAIVSAIEMFTFVYFLKNEDVMSLILLMFSVSVVFESPMSHETEKG